MTTVSVPGPPGGAGDSLHWREAGRWHREHSAPLYLSTEAHTSGPGSRPRNTADHKKRPGVSKTRAASSCHVSTANQACNSFSHIKDRQ